ncbi:hypothetical protein EDP2_3909 [Enterobacter cloacae S611]|uniref:Uncharacterized protein n=1 Tax=Enterobacter cloacae S611 TaxID=1399146 RepID=A0ABP2ZTN8_ENTCL|nr:hypothetical protein EDP2_3909 [Enterobacter cloacae S611]
MNILVDAVIGMISPVVHNTIVRQNPCCRQTAIRIDNERRSVLLSKMLHPARNKQATLRSMVRIAINIEIRNESVVLIPQQLFKLCNDGFVGSNAFNRV